MREKGEESGSGAPLFQLRHTLRKRVKLNEGAAGPCGRGFSWLNSLN
jgi:hypothetical protein